MTALMVTSLEGSVFAANVDTETNTYENIEDVLVVEDDDEKEGTINYVTEEQVDESADLTVNDAESTVDTSGWSYDNYYNYFNTGDSDNDGLSETTAWEINTKDDLFVMNDYLNSDAYQFGNYWKLMEK